MKINTLHLIAYGSFTDTVLDFSAAPSAFHMVYGPNEAGKSTALRALRNMLFGIPTRTPDSFRHPHPKLRIGAELLRHDGEVLAFIRRKGLRKTLRAANDETLLDDNALAPFLGGVSRDLFEQMFAIDHQGLILGGEEIIAGGGRVGQALFATGAGLIQLRRFQQDLTQTMEGLFKPNGSKPRINQIVSSLKATRKSQKEAQLLAKTWEVHHQHLHDAETRLETNRQRLGESQKAYNALERIIEALPLIARRKEIHTALPAFENAPDLPEDFETKRREAENDLLMAANDVRRSQETIATIQAEMNALQVPKALLQHAPLVESLQQDLGSYRKAQQDRPVLETRRRTLHNQAAKKLSQTGIVDLAADSGRLGAYDGREVPVDLRLLRHEAAGQDRWHVEGAVFLHQRDHFVVHEGAVLDRAHAGAHVDGRAVEVGVEERKASGRVCLVIVRRSRQQHDLVGNLRGRGPDLAPVDGVAVALSDGPGLEARGVEPAQHGLDAGQELPLAERFGHVVIRA